MKPFVSFREIGSLGRLGNQLFQYAALRALSLRNNCDFCLPPLENAEWHGQKCILDKFFNIPQHRFFSWHEFENVRYWYREPDYTKFDENFKWVGEFSNISGFFQSILYFEEFQDTIKKELTPREQVTNNGRTYNPLEEAKKYIRGLQDKHGCKIVSLHIRMGDGIDNTNQKQSYEFKKYYFMPCITNNPDDCNQIPYSRWESYFRSCKNHFEEQGENVKYLVFTGGRRVKNDDYDYSVQLCKDLLKNEKDVIYPENIDLLDDFCRIMMCDHSILSPASSLGWWAAYLGEDKVDGKKIMAPIYYHPDNPRITYRDGFYPKEWKLFS